METKTGTRCDNCSFRCYPDNKYFACSLYTGRTIEDALEICEISLSEQDIEALQD